MKKYFAWGAGILVAAAVALLVSALPAQEAYCTVCAPSARRGLMACALPGNGFRAPHGQATPFSALLEEKHLVGAIPIAGSLRRSSRIPGLNLARRWWNHSGSLTLRAWSISCAMWRIMPTR